MKMKSALFLLLAISLIAFAETTNISVTFDTRDSILVKDGFTPEQAVQGSYITALRQKRVAYVNAAMTKATDRQQQDVMEFCRTNIVSPP